MIDEQRFFTNLDIEEQRQRWATPQDTKSVERHYRARLIRMMEGLGIGSIAVCGANDPVDLLVAAPSGRDGVRSYAVELKVSRAARQSNGRHTQRYQALLQGNGHHLNGDLVIFLCVDPEDRLWPFVIPTALVAGQATLAVTSHPRTYQGRWAPFLGAFDYFRGGDVSTLADIASDMMAQALRSGRAVRELPRGLEITLVCAGGQWTLALARPAVMPAEEEVDICRRAFTKCLPGGVPDDAERHDGDRTVTLRWEARSVRRLEEQ